LPADIQILADELDISKDIATSMLKKHNGDLKMALTSFINGN
jgi:NACalpha-BTF3-like transcription factor